jgi:1-acyl-sn-glycerol-3-phosphate acyltransferase
MTRDHQLEQHDPNALQKLVGLAMWAPGLAWLTGMMGTMMLAQRFIEPDQLEWLTRIYTAGQIRVLGGRISYRVHPEIDPARPYVFVQNHVNLLDHCTVYNGTPHFKQGIELASHFEIPFYGWFMKQRGTIPVYRGTDARMENRKLSNAIRREVEKGHSILVFPEGTRTRTGRVGPFRAGVFRIAHELGLPIVPVAVTGMFEMLRTGAPYIHPGRRVTVYLERPIETTAYARRELPQLVKQVQRTVAQRVDDYYERRMPSLQRANEVEDLPSLRRA